ncbi:MAG: hypothetical protein ISR55_05130 [Bacteroidetes bacterium]|nr:hypothetical protein [Bacteroidota bacterium]
MNTLNKILNKCEELAFDLNFTHAKNWKKEAADRLLIGNMPIYFPRERVHATNGLAVGILGVGDKTLIIKIVWIAILMHYLNPDQLP